MTALRPIPNHRGPHHSQQSKAAPHRAGSQDGSSASRARIRLCGPPPPPPPNPGHPHSATQRPTQLKADQNSAAQQRESSRDGPKRKQSGGGTARCRRHAPRHRMMDRAMDPQSDACNNTVARCVNSYNSWVTLPSRWGPSPVRSPNRRHHHGTPSCPQVRGVAAIPGKCRNSAERSGAIASSLKPGRIT